MTTEEYKATPEQWAHQETWLDQNDADAACLLELRSRVKALEEAEKDRVFAASVEALDLLDPVQDLAARIEALEAGLKDEADCNKTCTLNLSDRLVRVEQRVRELQAARNAEINWQGEQDGRLKATEERLAILENAENGRQQDEDAERAAEPAPAPAGSLVERVAGTLHAATNSDPNVPANEWIPEARAAIREVAAWLRLERQSPMTADVLEQEADRG